jgi:hypothetical protein
MSLALEDPETIIEVPESILGDARTPTPDFIARVRFAPEWGQFQLAGLWRELGFQPTGGPVLTENAWGFNFTGMLEATRRDRVYYQILFGEGIGSYKGMPDVAPASAQTAEVLPMFGWMVGWAHQWNDRWSSNFTYSEDRLDNRFFQSGDDLHANSYLAVNLIWNPATRFYWGVEYLYGTREDVDGARGDANRIQMSVIYELP